MSDYFVKDLIKDNQMNKTEIIFLKTELQERKKEIDSLKNKIEDLSYDLHQLWKKVYHY